MKKILLTLTWLLTLVFNSSAQTYPFSIENTSGGTLSIYNTSTTSTAIDYLPNGAKLVSQILKNGRYMINTADALGGSSNYYFINANSVVPACNIDIIEITATTCYVRGSAGTSSFIYVKGGTKDTCYANVGERYAYKGYKYNGSTLWYEIYLTNRWSQSTGWVSFNVAKKISSNTDAIVPPTLNNSFNNAPDKFDISWSYSNGAANYDVYVNSAVKNYSSSPQTISGLNPSTNYPVYLIAKNTSGCVSSKSNTVNCLTTSGTFSAPNNFKILNYGPTSLQATWDASIGATSYDIWQNCSSSSKLNTTNLYYDFTGLTPGQTYQYLVEAKNGTSKAATSCENGTLPDYPPSLSSPSNSANGIAVSDVNFTWSNSPNNSSLYTIQISDNSNFNNPVTHAGLSTSTNYTLPTGIYLSSNTKYYWRVASAIPGVYVGNYSNYYSFTTTNSTTSYTVSGNVKDNNGNPLNGVQINYGSNLVFTNSNGDYNFTINNGWNGTVTPSLSNYTFNPTYLNVNVINANVPNKNFVGTLYTKSIIISGYIKDASLNGIKDVKINDGNSDVTTTNSIGYYSYTATKPYSKTITPIKNSYTFSPTNKTFPNVTVDQTQNFTGTASSFPTLNLLSPKGGENIYEESTYNITWSSNSVSQIKIEYSINGSAWNTIVSSVIASLGSFSWKLPVIGSKQNNCFVRITELGGSLSAVNTSAFTINPKPTFWMGIHTIHKDNNGKLKPYKLSEGTSYDSKNGSITAARICADGSKVTKIELNCDDKNYDLKNIRFRINSYKDLLSKDYSGYFDEKDYNFSDPYLLSAFLNHPTYMDESNYHRADAIIAYDKNNPDLELFSFPIWIYRAPILFVHGWIGDPGAFDEIQYSVHQLPTLIHKADYKKTNGVSFIENSSIVSKETLKLLDKAFEQKYSAGKVAIVAHSMGGILSRLYIQSTYESYQNNVARLITLNTPHSGTQLANRFLIAGEIWAWVNQGGVGALKDMQVDGEGIRKYLNGSSLSNGNKVPSHAVATVFTNDNFEFTDEVIENLKILAKISGKTLGEFIAATFVYERNDLVVPLNSQYGGLLGNNKSLINGQGHIGSAKYWAVKDQVDLLLKQNPFGNYYSQTGFSPPTYNFIKLFKKEEQEIIDGSIKLLKPQKYEEFFSGDSIYIITESNQRINSVSFMGGNIYNKSILESNDGTGVITFKYKIPKDAIGEIRILVLGFNEEGLVDYDTVRIKIKIPDGVVLDSIYSIPDNLYLYQNTISKFSVMGKYSDGITRPIDNYNEMEISELDSTIANYISSDVVKGLNIDTTIINIWYLGKTTILKVKVLEPIGSILDINDKEKNSYNSLSAKPLNIFPNPNSGQFNIELHARIGEPITIEIFNQIGQRVFIKNERATDNLFNKTILLDKVASGIYYIKATTATENFINKVMIAN
jgi:pimeloyl-ACP methyl ester carboxylesterase